AKLLKIKRRAKAIQRVGDEKALSFATGILDDMKKMTKTGKITDKGVKELLEAVERRSLSAGLPDSAKPLWDKLVKYADTISRERQKIGKTLLDEVDYSYCPSFLSFNPHEVERHRN
ncbi:MAG: hypothetical protein KJ864_06190, partial [Candidatus Omnitrophica bacterium]|nr:hypothetical protein [Candidatus Omnitrophota bacterium]